MHEAALACAAAPAPAVVLGMLLRPLSLGHIILFHRETLIESVQAGKLTPIQLSTAVLLCCQTWDENKSVRFDRLIRFKLWVWKHRVSRAARRHARMWSIGTLSYFEHEGRKFFDYLTSGALDLPISDIPRTDRSVPRRLPGAPYILRIQQWLMVTFGMTESQAWDYPFGMAKMRWSCHWEMEGGLDIQNEHDVEFDRFIAEQEAAGAAQLTKK